MEGGGLGGVGSGDGGGAGYKLKVHSVHTSDYSSFIKQN